MSDAKRFTQTQDAVKNNDPPIEINQRWIALDSNGKVYRRLRILAKHPDKDFWIVEDEPAQMKLDTYLRVCPEFNLRYIFHLE